MKQNVKIFAVATLSLFLVGCEKPVEIAAPKAQDLPSDAVGYFCGMTVENHAGPKGQIFLVGQDKPLWFTSVRDTLAYTRLPEETAPIAAVYVSDMGRAASWEMPGDDAWMTAENAYFVLGSEKLGGMGAAEAVPFSNEQDAQMFMAEYGGKLMRLGDIPDHHLLGSDDHEG